MAQLDRLEGGRAERRAGGLGGVEQEPVREVLPALLLPCSVEHGRQTFAFVFVYRLNFLPAFSAQPFQCDLCLNPPLYFPARLIASVLMRVADCCTSELFMADVCVCV